MITLRTLAVATLAAAVLVPSAASQSRGAELEPVRTLPACATDEGPDGQPNRGCVWDSHAEGNGEGRSFVIRRDSAAAHGSLTYVSHARAHLLLFGDQR